MNLERRRGADVGETTHMSRRRISSSHHRGLWSRYPANLPLSAAFEFILSVHRISTQCARARSAMSPSPRPATTKRVHKTLGTAYLFRCDSHGHTAGISRYGQCATIGPPRLPFLRLLLPHDSTTRSSQTSTTTVHSLQVRRRQPRLYETHNSVSTFIPVARYFQSPSSPTLSDS